MKYSLRIHMKKDKTSVYIMSCNISNAQTLVQTDFRIRKRRTWIAVETVILARNASRVILKFTSSSRNVENYKRLCIVINCNVLYIQPHWLQRMDIGDHGVAGGGVLTQSNVNILTDKEKDDRELVTILVVEIHALEALPRKQSANHAVVSLLIII